MTQCLIMEGRFPDLEKVMILDKDGTVLWETADLEEFCSFLREAAKAKKNKDGRQ